MDMAHLMHSSKHSMHRRYRVRIVECQLVNIGPTPSITAGHEFNIKIESPVAFHVCIILKPRIVWICISGSKNCIITENLSLAIFFELLHKRIIPHSAFKLDIFDSLNFTIRIVGILNQSLHVIQNGHIGSVTFVDNTLDFCFVSGPIPDHSINDTVINKIIKILDSMIYKILANVCIIALALRLINRRCDLLRVII